MNVINKNTFYRKIFLSPYINDIKDQIGLCEPQASEFYKSKKETGVDLFKMYPMEKRLN